jgi:hypothetical protein
MDIEIPCTKFEIDANKLTFSKDGNVMYAHTNSETCAYSLPDMKILEKMPKKITEINNSTTHVIGNGFVTISRSNFTISNNGCSRVIDDCIAQFVIHRDHLYYHVDKIEHIDVMIKRIQVNNIDVNKAEVELIRIAPRLSSYNTIYEMKADDKYNRLLINQNNCLLVFNLDSMTVERTIGYLREFTNEYAICVNHNNNSYDHILLYHLLSGKIINMKVPGYYYPRWPTLTDKYIIFPLENSKRIYTVEGLLYAELFEEYGLSGKNDEVTIIEDNVIVKYDYCVCIYDLSPFNKEKQKLTFFLGGISKDSSVSNLFMQDGLYDRHLLPLITEYV